MQMSHFCSKCHKECKDKRGLAIHENKCDGAQAIKAHVCEHCQEIFKSNDNLKKHQLSRCKAMKEKERDQLEEDRLQELREMCKKYKEHIHLLQEQNRLLQERHQMKIECIKKECEVQLRHRINDTTTSSVSDSLDSIDEEISRVKRSNDDLHEEIKKERVRFFEI